MIITEKMFKEYKKNIEKGDVLIYAEKTAGDFHNSMVGEAFDITVAFACLIQNFSEKCKMSPFEILSDIGGILKKYDEMEREGGEH